jgi:Sec-independent protein translocase protein TatA
MTDLLVALFVAILVVAALNVPRWGDALGRLLRRDRSGRGDGGAPADDAGGRR